MKGRELAYNICRVWAQDIVDDRGGMTLGGKYMDETRQ